MFKETKKIAWAGGLALLVLIIVSALMFSPSKNKAVKVNIPIDKDSYIVSDGEYIFFNNPDGDVMMMHAFETTPELFMHGWKVLSVSDNNMVMRQDKETVGVFDRQEKGILETYEIKSDTVYCTEGAVYYKDTKTKLIMQIDRKTKEEVVFLTSPVNDFTISGDILIVALAEKGKGMAMFDYKAGTAASYALEKTVSKVCYANNMIAYTEKSGKVRRLNLGNANDIKVKKVKSDGLCFAKGVYFYIDKKWGGYKLCINDSDAFR